MTATTILPLVVGLFAATSGGLVTLLVAKQKTSGRIGTSEAETLWDEGKAMRLELRSEVVSLRADVDRLQAEAAALHVEMRGLRDEADDLRGQNQVLRDENARLRASA